ncbi:hypothetical protein [Tumebacillus lipolyticus]|uniref:Uncharacterized protein n=1 Tax=Tumebacillus lipolyticus TaxID=1280370 RepID=A0ABW5A287_9BACL
MLYEIAFPLANLDRLIDFRRYDEHRVLLRTKRLGEVEQKIDRRGICDAAGPAALDGQQKQTSPIDKSQMTAPNVSAEPEPHLLLSALLFFFRRHIHCRDG